MTWIKDTQWTGFSLLLPPSDFFPVSVLVSESCCIWQADTPFQLRWMERALSIRFMLSFQDVSCSTVSKEPSFHECPGRWLFDKVLWNSLSQNGHATSYQPSGRKPCAVVSLRSVGLTECTNKRTTWPWGCFLSRSIANSHSIRTVSGGWKFSESLRWGHSSFLQNFHKGRVRMRNKCSV